MDTATMKRADQARKSRLQLILERTAAEIATELAREATPTTASGWMRAVDSPLGAKRAIELGRAGAFALAKPSKHYLLDRAGHDAWIATHVSTPVEAFIATTAGELDEDLLQALRGKGGAR